MDFKEIRSKITSEDKNILKRSILFVDDRLILIREKVKFAEARATTMLAFVGILTGFLIHFTNTIDKLKLSESVLIIGLFLASLLLIVKAMYYSVRTLWVTKVYELNTDLVYELLDKSELEALKEELTGKIWEYWTTILIPTGKLFWLNRAQRNTVAAIIAYLFLGLVLFLKVKLNVWLCQSVSIIATFLLGVIVIFIDRLMEHYGTLWHK